MRKLFLLLIAMTICMAAMPQALNDVKMQNLAGINYYYTMNTVGCDTFGLNKKTFMEPGYGFGVTYKHFELARIIGFQAELNYDYQGYTIRPNDELYYTQMYKFLQVPIYAHVDIGKHAVKGLFAIGTFGQFMIDHGQAKTNIVDFGDTSSVKRIYRGKFKTFSYGLCGQVGLAICTKAGVFEILGRANIAMSSFMDMGKLRLFNNISTRSFGGGVSYLVPFGNGEKYYTKREKIKKEKKKDKDADDEPVTEEAPEDSVDTDGESSENPDGSDATEDTPKPEDEENWEERM